MVKYLDGIQVEFDNFNRNYKIFNSKGDIIKSSTSRIDLANMEKYFAHIKCIDSLSNVYYNITKRCNFNCSYCYSKNNNSSIDLQNNKKILKKLKELNTKSITLIGGEPFCHPFFYELLEYIINMNYFQEICIVTNGSLIDFTKIDIFKNDKIYLQISLDGISEETNRLTRDAGSFDKIMENIKLLKNNQIRFRIMQVITRDNIKFSKEYYSHYKSMGIEAGFFMVKQVNEDIKPTIEQLEELLDYIYYNENQNIQKAIGIVKFADNMMFDVTGFPITHCGAGINSISINPNGDVFPCVKMENGDKFITNLFDIEATEKIKLNRKRILNSELVNNKKPCIDCSIKFFCGGGCRAEEKDGIPCPSNCLYFKFALDYFAKMIA
jgi:radical SAM protein with 4Fe4S-binding SPASM domain